MAATSETDICSSALVKIGQEAITSLADNTPRARACSVIYNKIRDTLLRSHPWNFAVQRVELAEVDEDVEFDYSNQFELPVDCLRVIDTDLNEGEPWEVENTRLMCNSSSIKIKYIKQITTVADFDQNFAEVLSWAVAKEVAYQLTGSLEVANFANQSYLQALREARSFDAQESSPQRVQANTWLNTRF